MGPSQISNKPIHHEFKLLYFLMNNIMRHVLRVVTRRFSEHVHFRGYEHTRCVWYTSIDE